jgi:hypothetical protein
MRILEIEKGIEISLGHFIDFSVAEAIKVVGRSEFAGFCMYKKFTIGYFKKSINICVII